MIVKTKLTELLFHLDQLPNQDINEIRSHYMKFSRECGQCHDCELRYHVLEVYQLHKSLHKHNQRKSADYQWAEMFVHKHYDEKIFGNEDEERDRFFTEHGYVSK